jgi:hypothetical protein
VRTCTPPPLHTHTYIYIYTQHKIILQMRSHLSVPLHHLQQACILCCKRYKILTLLKSDKAVGHCMVKSVLLVQCGSNCTCNSKVLFQCLLPTSTPETPKQDFWIAYAATATFYKQYRYVLPYNDLLLYIILIFHNFSKHNI